MTDKNKRFRSITIDRASIKDNAESFPIALSSEAVVNGEILSHRAGDVDMVRAENGLPVIWHHGRDPSVGLTPIGVVRDIRVDADRVMRGNMSFAKSERAQEFKSLVEDDMLRDASIGAMIDPDSVEFSDDTATIRSWMPYELSLTPIPLDGTVGVNRAAELDQSEDVEKIEISTTNQEGDKAMSNETEASNVSPIDLSHATQRGVDQEAKRRDNIDKVVEPYLNIEGVNSLRKRAIAENLEALDVSIELNKIVSRGIVMKERPVAESAEPTALDNRETEERSAMPAIQMGADKIDKFGEAMTDAIMYRGKVVFDAEGKEDRERMIAIRKDNPYLNSSLLDMVKEYAEIVNLDLKRDPLEIGVTRAMRHRAGGMGNADLPALIENIMNKMMMVPLTPAEENWRPLVRTSSLSDYKQTSRVNMGSASDLQEIANGGPIQRGYIADFKEYLQAKTFGVELVVEYQTLRNDDVGALTSLPLEIRRKGNKKVGDLVWAIFTTNPTLGATSAAVFTAGQGNLITSGAAPSVTTIEAAMAAMATQKAPSPTGDDTNDPGDPLNIMPQFLLVPHALKGRAEQLRTSMYDPDASAGSQTSNTVNGRFDVIADARLDTFNAAGWFMAANPSQHPTIEVGFVDGQETPLVMQEDDWGTRGVKFAVWHDFDVKAMDYRGLYYNDGVT